MDRLVAVKLLHPKLAADPEFLQRLTREAHTAAKLSHNNIVQAIDVGSAGPLHYFVMELVEGKTIRQEMDAGKKYTEREALEIVVRSRSASTRCPARPGASRREASQHRADGRRRGEAGRPRHGPRRGRHGPSEARKGTCHRYALLHRSGTGARPTRCGCARDMYSLGTTLYHMTTGQPPFPGKDVDRLLEAHLTEELTPPDHINQNLSSGLGEVVEFMMAKDRRKRYTTADDLIIDLECLLAGEAPSWRGERSRRGRCANWRRARRTSRKIGRSQRRGRRCRGFGSASLAVYWD